MVNLPYIIVAPPFRHNSAGIRVLHKLGHLLTEAGQTAYIFNKKTNPKWSISSISFAKTYKLIKKGAIVIYPEIVKGNPLNSQVVVRYVLNNPGLLGGDKVFDGSEIVFYFTRLLAPNTAAHKRVLCLPTIETDIFFADQREKDLDYLVYFGKHPIIKNYPKEKVISNSWPAKSFELAELLRRCRKLISYDNFTALTFEATLCGCLAVIVPDGFREKADFNNSEFGTNGIAWGDSAAEIRRAQATLDQAPLTLKHLEEKVEKSVQNFIKITQTTGKQQLASQKPAKRKRTFSQKFVTKIKLIINYYNLYKEMQ